MAPDWKLQIYNFVLKKQKNYHETRLEDILKNKIVAELFEDAEKQYVYFIKKCLVLKEMSDPKNDPKW